eukprot:92278_1
MATYWSILLTAFSWAALIWSFRDNKKLLKGLLFGTFIAIWFLYASIFIPLLALISLLFILITGIGWIINKHKTMEIISCIRYNVKAFKTNYLDEPIQSNKATEKATND